MIDNYWDIFHSLTERRPVGWLVGRRSVYVESWPFIAHSCCGQRGNPRKADFYAFEDHDGSGGSRNAINVDGLINLLAIK